MDYLKRKFQKKNIPSAPTSTPVSPFTGKRKNSMPAPLVIPESPTESPSELPKESPPRPDSFFTPDTPDITPRVSSDSQLDRINQLNQRVDQLLANTEFSEPEMNQLTTRENNSKSELDELKKSIKKINKNMNRIVKLIKTKERKMEQANETMKNNMLLFQKLDTVQSNIKAEVIKNRINKSRGIIKDSTHEINDLHHEVKQDKHNISKTTKDIDLRANEIKQIRAKINQMSIAIKNQTKFLEQALGSTGGSAKLKKLSFKEINKRFKLQTRYLSIINSLKKLTRKALEKIATGLKIINPKKFATKESLIAIISLFIHANYGIRTSLEDFIIIAANLGIQYTDYMKNHPGTLIAKNKAFINMIRVHLQRIPYKTIFEVYSQKLFN